MKIFGWMHKKLHLGSEYHRFAHKNNIPDARDNGTVSAAREKERDTESLLLPHVLLTIGTLGHSHPPPPPQPQPQPQEQSLDDHHNEASDDDTKFEKENPPTMLFHSSTIAMHIINPELVITDPKPKQLDAGMEEEEEEEIISMEPLLKEDPAKVEKRMTLAELFAAEPTVAPVPSAVLTLSTVTSSAINKSFKKNKKLSKEEKGEDHLPAKNATKKKIHQLITRMMKKRIHPDHVVARADHEAQQGKKGDMEGLTSPPRGRTNHRFVVHLTC